MRSVFGFVSRVFIVSCAALATGCGASDDAGSATLPTGKVLGTAAHDAYRLAVSDEAVFFTDRGSRGIDGWNHDGGLFVLSKAGGDPVAISQGEIAMDVAVDGDEVYWTSDRGVQRTKIGAVQIEQLDADPAADLLAVGEGSIVWTSADMQGDGVTRVFAMPKAGGARTVIATDVGFAGGIAVDADAVYWNATHGLAKGPIQGGDTTVLDKGSDKALALDAESAFWCDETGIHAVATSGGSDGMLVGGPQVQTFALDASSVYWVTVTAAVADGAGPSFFRTDRSSDESEAFSQYGGTHLALDAAAVYWTDGRAIRTLPK